MAAEVGASQNGSASADLEIQAVESIPRETLVALLRRKSKESKAIEAKLEKIEERYVKVVKYNKILMEDRGSFMRFCSELISESDGLFEEAAAQESPVNLSALLRQLCNWRHEFEAAGEDRNTFRRFVELVFPGDHALSNLFSGTALGSGAFDILEQKWAAQADLHNQSIASINANARELLVEKNIDFEALEKSKKEVERKVEDLREQLTQVAREKAQMLTQRLQGTGSAGGAAANDVAAAGAVSAEACAAAVAAATATATASAQQELEELKKAQDASERRERRSREVAAAREQELLGEVEVHKAEARRVCKEIELMREDAERRRSEVQQLVQQKDSALEQLQTRMSELEEELKSNAFITQCAEAQAGRDAELRAQNRQVAQLNNSVLEMQKLLGLSYAQDKALKDRIRELEQSHGRSHVAGDYLKYVVLRYVQYCQAGDSKSQSLVPVLCTLLNFSSEERQSVEPPALAGSLLALGQAVTGASLWRRGQVESSDTTASVVDDSNAAG